MKDMILVAERVGELLAMENVDKTTISKVAKVSSTIVLRNKHSWAISNTDMDITKDLGLISIKKYWKRASQIQNKVDLLYKDWILALRAFVKHFRRTHNNKEVIKNMLI